MHRHAVCQYLWISGKLRLDDWSSDEKGIRRDGVKDGFLYDIRLKTFGPNDKRFKHRNIHLT